MVLVKSELTKMANLQAACQSLRELEGDDQKVKTRWINEAETYFRSFRVSVVHCSKSPIEVIESVHDADIDVAWGFLMRLSEDRSPYTTRCEEVLRILMLSDKWMNRFKELQYNVDNLAPAVRGDFSDELKRVGNTESHEFKFRVICDNKARMAAVRRDLEDTAKPELAKAAQSDNAAVALCFTPTPTNLKGCTRYISAAIPIDGGNYEALDLAEFWPHFLEAKKLNIGAVQVIEARCIAIDPYDAPCVAFATLILHFGGAVTKVSVEKARGYICSITHTSGCVSILHLLPGVDGLDAPKSLAPFVLITSERGQVAFDTGKLVSQLGAEEKIQTKQCGGLRQACSTACGGLVNRFKDRKKPPSYSSGLIELLTSLRSHIIPQKKKSLRG